MTIGKKLYVNFGIILTMVLVLFLVNWSAVQREHAAKKAAQESLDLKDATNAVRFQMMQNRLYLSNYLLSGDTREVDRMNEGLRTLNEKLDQGKSLASSDQVKTSLDKVQQLEQSWGKEFAQPLIEKRKDVDSGNATVAELQIYYLQKDASSWVKNSTDSLDVADGENNKVVDERHKSDDSAANWTIAVSLISTLLALSLGIVIAYRTAKAITEPLTNLMNVARGIGNTGDLEHNIDLTRHDEIGELARTFHKMVTYLKEMAGGFGSHRRRRSDARGEAAFDARHPGQRLRQDGRRPAPDWCSSVRDASSQVASASNQVAGASDESAKIGLQASSAIDEVTSTMHEMSVNVQNMVKSTQVQASSVSETSASIDQMVASIQRVADTAKVLLDISNRSREEVHNGIGTMEKATDGLNRINTTITSSGEIIGALGQRADDIGKIIEVIDDLAEQTNLLALNAAIEAARAGEHGLGFAVVADEVRKLAEKSAQSTKEISELIQSIQKEARKAVENMDRSTTIVNEGLELGGELNSALQQDLQRGHRSLQVRAGNRRGHQRTVARLVADCARHHPAERNHARNQLRGRRAGLRSAGRGQGHGTDARTGAAVDLQFDRTGRFVRADVEDVAQPARIHRPLRAGRSCASRKLRRRQARTQRARAPQRERSTKPCRSPRRMSRELHIVGFQVGRETYGVPITSLHEIVRVPEITAVPDAPDYLEGVINLRGKIVSVMDLRKRFGEKQAAVKKNNRILVVEHAGQAGRADRGFGLGGPEDSCRRGGSSARSIPGRRIELRDRTGKSWGTADRSARYEQATGPGESRKQRRARGQENSSQGRGAVIVSGSSIQRQRGARTGMSTSGAAPAPILTEAELKLLQALVYQECGMALRRAPHPFPPGPAAAPAEGVPRRLVLCLLSSADQPARQGRTRQAARESHRQRNQLLPPQGATRSFPENRTGRTVEA